MLGTSLKAKRLADSMAREISALCRRHGAVDLADDCPDFPAPRDLKAAAKRAVVADVARDAGPAGAPSLREAIAAKCARFRDFKVDAEREITVTCGATEAMTAAILASVDPGDEVVVIEPSWENYGSAAVLAGAIPRIVTLHEPDWALDTDELAAAFGDRTRGIIVNSPHNPTGKVLDRTELEAIADLCRKWDVVAFSDEVYEHLVYEGAEHIPIATLPGMSDRTVTVGALSATYAVEGWRVGWAVASPLLTEGIRRIHEVLALDAPAPLQEAGVAALSIGPTYYRSLVAAYRARRDVLLDGLDEVGFACEIPAGACHIMASLSGLGATDDVAFARRLVEEVGVGCVPGSCFWSEPERGRGYVRFAFSKREEVLRDAVARLARGLAN